MSAHTPGPWKTNGIFVESGEMLIAQAYGCECGDNEAHANASLIAAAPELLGQHEADIADLDLLEEAMLKDDHQYQLLLRIEDMKRRKKTVIAKAKGGDA